MSQDIHCGFVDKSLFLTGVTGFVGKVFLYKFLKEFPKLRAVYVLVRPKAKQLPKDRFEKEVLSSPCFEMLRDVLGAAEYARRTGLVIAVAGDITEDNLGMSAHDYKMVANDINFIAHLAATVDFNEKLNISVKMNVLGPLRVLALAQKSPQLESFIHVSTCYVNWNRHGPTPVKEELYNLPFSPEAMSKHILSTHDDLIEAEQKKIMEQYNYPNTYTLTKAMAEHILRSRKGKLPMTIVRPAIVGCSWREPAPGWTDALTAAGGLFLTAGLGILREANIARKYIADVVPVDYVVNTMIKAMYKTAVHYKAVNDANAAERQQQHRSEDPQRLRGAVGVPVGLYGKAAPMISNNSNSPQQSAESQLVTSNGVPPSSQLARLLVTESVDMEPGSLFPFVFVSGTSHSLNHLKWHVCVAAIVQYWNQNPHPKALGTCDPILYDSYFHYQLMITLRRRIPVYGMRLLANLPAPIGSEEKRDLVARYEKAIHRSMDLNAQFTPFMTKEWVFDTSNNYLLEENLCPTSRDAFATDVYDINWFVYIQAYSFGLIKYIMKSVHGHSLPIIPPSGSEQFLKASL